MNSKYKDLDGIKMMTLCLYGEGRGERIEGQVAIGSVIINRTKLSRKTVKSVCLQAKQFSCFNSSDTNSSILEEIAMDWDKHIESDKALRQCYWVAKGLIEGWIKGNVKNATHYHHVDSNPVWAAKIEKLMKIGNHQFYFEKGWR